MKLGILAASLAAVALGAGSASAQPVVLVPHRDHYHVVPAYPPPFPPPPVFSYGSYRPGLSFGFSFGSQPSFGPGFVPPPTFGPGFGYGGYRPGGFTPGWGGGHPHPHR